MFSICKLCPSYSLKQNESYEDKPCYISYLVTDSRGLFIKFGGYGFVLVDDVTQDIHFRKLQFDKKEIDFFLIKSKSFLFIFLYKKATNCFHQWHASKQHFNLQFNATETTATVWKQGWLYNKVIQNIWLFSMQNFVN